jgi:uncharacterized protein with GYD domain
VVVAGAVESEEDASCTTTPGGVMPKYMWKVSYTKAGVRGVAAEGGSSRRDAVRHAVESVGGTLDAVYFAFGEADVYVIADLPDNESAAAVSLAANSTDGLVLQTVILMTAAELDAAADKEVSFRPPGG